MSLKRRLQWWWHERRCAHNKHSWYDHPEGWFRLDHWADAPGFPSFHFACRWCPKEKISVMPFVKGAR